ncbi:glycerophosphodiester phosphodiesterase [Sediminibacterium ginsengisoli]|uniref:Glycerophosphoryl diester phosphodiesterase n=1 Tax=Sediminibacterium ginsengisoli TaxID=413434 RepID=A0A1T4M3G8_9BACT|nr:glycerophosphodiester phosphodiesterase [Sediminibacterium ginsengisoli]SJZ61416.1 glycerophosphoryl diester phosphodiesterase [Sediminibacterium ginsengisoli]
MKKTAGILCAATLLTAGVHAQKTRKIDFEAHRGGRGLMPENTIPAMKHAIDLGIVQTLEMDVVITKDKKVVVSHDPYFNPAITTTPQGTFFDPKDGPKTLLYTMTYDSISKYDVGMKGHPDFPHQQKLAVKKPLLADLIDAVEQYAGKRKMLYNIEIKSKEKTDNINHPDPQEFVTLVAAVLKEKKIMDRVVIQSFDPRPLNLLHKMYPELKLSFLVDKDAGKLEEQLAKLAFTPDTYSPAFATVTKEMVDACHQKNIKVLPWTVNTKEEMVKQIGLGVDGIISDYPDLFKQLN